MKDELENHLDYFNCKACNKKRVWTELNTFKHPMVENDSAKIYGYHNFNYCYDNLICYLKASRKEFFKYDR